MHPWRTDPALVGKFHPDHQDDLQVVAHDGGPRCSDKAPELVWVRVTEKKLDHYVGVCLNDPHGLTSIGKDRPLMFRACATAEYPFQVTDQYLKERGD